MPQHPVYDADPSVSMSELAELVDKLVKYGLAHEDVIYPITDEVMGELYLDAAKAAIEDIDEELDDDGSLLFYPSVSAVFDFLSDDDKQQFVRDLRNAIAIAMEGDFDGGADRVRALR